MTIPTENSSSIFRPLAFALAIILVLTLVAPPLASAQTFTVLHTFTGGGDGANPYSGLTLDRGGNLYGTAYAGGINSPAGTVFKLKNTDSGWLLTPLYEFSEQRGGANPASGVIFGPDGSLYGTTIGGGAGFGLVYKLQPPSSACKTSLCYWNLTMLYQFMAGSDGHRPTGNLIFDQAGNIYGTTETGGAYGYGSVYKLTHSGGTWTESMIYSFMAGQDGNQPLDGVVIDNAGNLYGTTRFGGLDNCSGGCGTVFELSPSGSGWTERILYAFPGPPNGYAPYAGVILDSFGNLYGATASGVVFQLSPAGGGWNYTVLYNLSNDAGIVARLTMDAAGNLYGTTLSTLFKLTPSGGQWTYTDLHDFTANDGGGSKASATLDSQGNVYGTAYAGGADGYGTAWEFRP